MATETTDQEWKHAVIGTVLSVSVGGILLGVFQLADGESIGTVPLFFGSVGIGLLFYRSWNSRRRVLEEQIDSSVTRFEDDPQDVLRERYARGDIDYTEFDRRLQRLQTSDGDRNEHDETDDTRTDRELVSERD